MQPTIRCIPGAWPTVSSGNQLAQNVLQDSAVAVVVRLARRVDPHQRIELGFGAVRAGRGYPHRGGNLALIHFSDARRSEEHTSELQSRGHLVCRLLLEKKKK